MDFEKYGDKRNYPGDYGKRVKCCLNFIMTAFSS